MEKDGTKIPRISTMSNVRTTKRAKKANIWNYGPSSQIYHILVHLQIFSDEFKELVK
jgi:hypothetical protein